MMNDRFLRNFKCEVRAERNEEHGTYITGQPIVFGASTDIGGMYEEIIDEGALDSADLKDVRFLVNHNVNMIPLSRSRNNNANSTMQLVVVPGEGLDIRANLDIENNADAKALYSATARGDLSGMSFMFVADKDRWDDMDTDHPTRTILSLKRVLEVSAVTFPAYSQTSLEARGLADALDSAKASLESAKAEAREIERKKQRIRILAEVQ
jgi:HK97 family phage prohead protease